MKLVKVAVACVNQTPLAWDANFAHLRTAIEHARAEGVSMLTFPDMPTNAVVLNVTLALLARTAGANVGCPMVGVFLNSIVLRSPKSPSPSVAENELSVAKESAA